MKINKTNLIAGLICAASVEVIYWTGVKIGFNLGRCCDYDATLIGTMSEAMGITELVDNVKAKFKRNEK